MTCSPGIKLGHIGGRRALPPLRQPCSNPVPTLLKAAKYEIEKPEICRATLLRFKFLIDVSRFSPCVINLSPNKNISCGLKKVVPQSRARVNFEQQILALLLVFHQTLNLSRNKFVVMPPSWMPTKQINQSACCIWWEVSALTIAPTLLTLGFYNFRSDRVTVQEREKMELDKERQEEEQKKIMEERMKTSRKVRNRQHTFDHSKQIHIARLHAEHLLRF